MKLQSAMRITIGSFVLLSAILTYFVSQWWLLFTVFIGVNLIQFGFTGFCPLEIIYKKLGLHS